MCERCHRCSDCCICETPIIRDKHVEVQPVEEAEEILAEPELETEAEPEPEPVLNH
jgi:hypothetical protein